MSEKKPGITMTDVKADVVKVAPKLHKPGITTNQVNVPAPAPRAEGIVRGPVITTHDEPLPKGTEALLREIEDKPYAEAYAKKISADFKADAGEVNTPIPDRDVDDMSKIEPVHTPAPAPVAKRKPAARKKAK